MSNGDLIDIRPVEMPYVLAEYPQCGVTYRVESSGMVYFEKSPGNWDFSHNTTTGEYKLARQIHSGPSVDDLHEVARSLRNAETKSAEIAGKLVDAVKAVQGLLREIIIVELRELKGESDPEDGVQWRAAVLAAEDVIKQAARREMTTCPCGDKFLLDKRPWAVIYSKCKPVCPDCSEKLRGTMEM